MEKHKITQLDRIARYADLIQKQAGKAVRPYRADGYVNMMTRYGTQKDASEQYKFVPEDAVPDELLTMYYEGNGLFAKIIDTPAEEAIKHGFELKDVSDQTVEDFYTEALDELDWEETAMTAIKWARLFGGSLAVMLINDGRGLDEPLDWRHIQSIDDIRVFDRSVIQPDYTTLFNYDPRDPFSTRGSRLGLPEYYQVFSKYGSFTVHDSRCLVFQNGILPENTTNSIYQLWGVPEYIRLHRAIRDAEVAHRSAPKMLDRSVQPIYKMQNLAAELATEEGESKVLRRLQVIDMARGLLNSLVIDAEGEDYDFKTFQFSGINDVVSASCNMLSALSNIPQTILFGQAVGGMSSTDDTSMENYYNYVERIQRRMLKSNLRYLLSIIFQAGLATGEVDEVPKIKIKFNPLWSLSDVEQADLEQKREQTKFTRAQTAQIYVGMQAIDPSEVRQKLADSEEFDVEAMLDEYDDDELFPDQIAGETPVDAQGQPVQPETGTSIFEEGDFAEYGQDVSVEEHNADPETGGNAPAAAPAATKLPQDMSAEELAEKAEKGVGNADGADEIINRPKESVGVLVISDGKVLSGTRHNDFGYGLVCGPGGHVEPGETPTQAAFRETEEEFGISPKELIPLGLGPYEPDTGLRPHLYLCTDYNGEPNCLDLEMTGAKFRTMQELDDLAASMFQPFADGLKILKTCIDTALFFGDDEGEMHDDLVDSIGKAVNGDLEKEDGGPGSGNHGHRGVPGEIGGSAPGSDKVTSPSSFRKGGGDFEVTGDVRDMYLTDTARARIEGAIQKVKTASDLKSYLSERGIALETSYEPLKKAMDREIPAVKRQADYVIAAVEQYDDLGGLSALKAVHIYEADLDVQAQYSYRATGEGEVPDEGHLYISDRADGFQIMHEFAHAYADSSKPDGMDVVEWSAKLNHDAGLPESSGAYFGASADVREAERFADAIGYALTDGEGRDGRITFLSKVANIVKGSNSAEPENLDAASDMFISENPIDKSAKKDTIKYQATIEDGGPGSGNHGHKGRPGQKGGSEHSLSPKEKAKITKRLVGQQTHDGITIRSVSSHAFDRIGGRKMSVGRIDRMRTEGVASPGNRPHTRCYDIDGSRMVIDTESGNVMTVMWRGGRKK